MTGEINVNQFGSGLQALYHLEDVNDSSGNGNTLTNTNTVAFNPAKFRNGADGGASNSNKRLSITNRLGYTGGAYSISFWIKLNAEIASSEWWFINIADNTTSKSSIGIAYEYNSGTRRLVFHRIKHGVSDTTFTHNITLGTDNWYNLAFTYDGTTLIGYLNSLPIGSLSSNGNGISAIADIFSILADRNNTLNTSGIIDEVLLTTATLTHKQIKDYYSWALGRRTTVA